MAKIKGKKSGKDIQTIEMNGGGQIYGTVHKNTKMVDDIIEEVENEGIDYFVNNLGHSLSDAIRWYANFDETGLEQYLADNEDRGATLASYDGDEEEQFYDNEFYYIYRID